MSKQGLDDYIYVYKFYCLKLTAPLPKMYRVVQLSLFRWSSGIGLSVCRLVIVLCQKCVSSFSFVLFYFVF